MNTLNRGITLVEILIVVAILGMIMGAVGAFQRDVFYLSSIARGSLSVSQDARGLLRVMVAELRSASPGSNGAYPVALAASSSITFFSDIDDDGLKEQIRYYLASTTLMKGVIKPTGSPYTYVSANETVNTVMSNMRNGTTSIFTYFDSGYAGTSSPLSFPVIVPSIRLIKIDLKLDADVNRAPISRVFTSQVSIRNLKDNL